MLAEDDEMEPPRTAVQALGGDAAEASQETLDLAVATVCRLDVHSTVPVRAPKVRSQDLQR